MGSEVDIVSNDHYLTAAREDAHVWLAMAADMTRSVAGGRPWLLMEHSTSAVNWQPRNIAKDPGEMARNSLSHVSRGSEGALFFQWRASRSGAEKFHSAMLPHGGPETRVFREVIELGADLRRLAAVRGSRVETRAAILWDWESFWAQDLEWRPSVDLDHRERTEAFYGRLWLDGIATDFAHPEGDLSGYDLVIAPQTYLLTRAASENLDGFVRGGGQLVVSYFSGVVDETDSVHAEGLSGPLGATLGVHVEEFAPLRTGQEVSLTWTDRQPGQRIGRRLDRAARPRREHRGPRDVRRWPLGRRSRGHAPPVGRRRGVVRRHPPRRALVRRAHEPGLRRRGHPARSGR